MKGSLLFQALSVLCLASFLLISCGSSSGGPKGTLSVMLTDAPAPEYQAVYVTIHEIQVQGADSPEDEWITLLRPDATFNLLELVGGSADPIGMADLPQGSYSRIRLILGESPDTGLNILDHPHPFGNYIVSPAGEERELKIPSGAASGIEIVHPFEVTAGSTTELMLDLDAFHSVVKGGKGRKWLLNPVARVIETLESATVSGTVSDPEQNTPALITMSAQRVASSASPAARKAGTGASTLCDSTGSYVMYVEPGTRLEPRSYFIVAYADGYSPACEKLTIPYSMDYPRNFTLRPAPMGTVTLNLSLPSTEEQGMIEVEFRQDAPCDTGRQFTVKIVSYPESGTYSVNLPQGVYSVRASCKGQEKEFASVRTGSSLHVGFPGR
jgi:hypothetical protein